MSTDIISAVLAFLGGCAIACFNSRLSYRMITGNSGNSSSYALIRQLLSLGYLTAVFFLSRALGLTLAYPLIGAGLGLTVPSVVLALYLSKKLRSAPPPEQGGTPDENGGEKNL